MKNGVAALIGALCLFLAGCVRCEQTYTLNPDGSGKVAIVLVMPFNPFDAAFGGGPAGPGGKPPTLADKKRAFLDKVLSKSRGVDAWKDVSAEYTPEGLLKFQGTAYFKDLHKLKVENGSGSPAKLERRQDGSLRLLFAPESFKTDLHKPKAKNLPDPRKLSDAELDEYILGKRAEYQSMKPLFSALLTDLKFTYTFRLPGDVSDVKVYRPEGKRAVSFEVDGNKFLKTINGVMARDNAFFRKQLRASGTMDLFGESKESFKLLGLNWDEASATVAKASPQFDYAKESAAAREDYPALRKRLGLGEEKKLPNFPDFK